MEFKAIKVGKVYKLKESLAEAKVLGKGIERLGYTVVIQLESGKVLTVKPWELI